MVDSLDNYFDDDVVLSSSGDYDEKFSDILIDEDKDFGVVKQLDNVISWRIDNLYTDKGKLRNKYSLLSDPPILSIHGHNGENVEFALTKDLSKTLKNAFTTIDNAYYGVDNHLGDESLKDKFVGVWRYLLHHKAISVVCLVLLLAFVLVPVIL